MKRTVIIGAVCALIGGVASAGANVSHVLGSGGKVYQFDAACHRTSFIPPGISVKEGLNVVAQQAKCLVRRPTMAACVRKLGPAPEVRIVAKDDWVGVDKLQAYVAAVGNCAIGTF